MLAPTDNMTTIHYDFGETWRVERDYWLFGLEARRTINRDIEKLTTYKPVYEAEFSDEELKVQAEEVSK